MPGFCIVTLMLQVHETIIPLIIILNLKMRRSRSCPLECHSYWFGEEFNYLLVFVWKESRPDPS